MHRSVPFGHGQDQDADGTGGDRRSCPPVLHRGGSRRRSAVSLSVRGQTRGFGMREEGWWVTQRERERELVRIKLISFFDFRGANNVVDESCRASIATEEPLAPIRQ